MCDTKKYYAYYQDMKKLGPSDTLQLIRETEDPDEKQFFKLLGDYLMQQKQKQIIEENLY